MEIQMKSRVQASDGPVGRVVRMVVHAETHQLTHVVVQPDHGEPLLVPIARVAEADDERVLLDIDTAGFLQCEPFLEHDVAEVPRPHALGQTLQSGGYMTAPGYDYQDIEVVSFTRERVPEGSVAVEPGARVHASDGQVGEVHEFLVHPTDGALTHMVLREGHFWGRKDVHIPVTAIARVEHDDVYLNLDKQAIEALPAIKVR